MSSWSIKSLVNSKWIYENLHYILFLALLTFAYIANAHYVESKLRRIARLKKDVAEANYQYMMLKSEIMRKSTYSNLKTELSDEGLKVEGDVANILTTAE